MYACVCVHVHLSVCAVINNRIYPHYTQEHQLKVKLNKQLREKEDYILQVLAKKRKLEKQLNMKEEEKVTLQQVSLSSLVVVIIGS